MLQKVHDRYSDCADRTEEVQKGVAVERLLELRGGGSWESNDTRAAIYEALRADQPR